MIGTTLEAGEPIFAKASRATLLDFLGRVSVIIEKAIVQGGHVHFGGGR